MADSHPARSHLNKKRLNNPEPERKHTSSYRNRFGMKLVLLLLIRICSIPSDAQQVVIQLVDKLTRSPVEFAYLVSRPLSSRQEDTQISDKEGKVNLNVTPPLVIRVSCLGYNEFTDTITAAGMHTISLSPRYYQLDQVVVTGQFRPQKADHSIYKINLIDSRQIQLKAASNMGDLLRTELDFQYRSEGVLGDFIRIRGLSGEYVKILIDGMPVTGRVFDRIDLGQLSLNNVDHIEIVEGPISVVYGSNALAGAINLITDDHSGKRFGLIANTYYESAGFYNFDAGISLSRGRHTFSANVARNFFLGWGPVDTSRYKTWKPKLQYLAGATYRYAHKQLRIMYFTDYLNEELRDPGALTLANLYEKALDGYHFTTRWNNRINITNTFNDDFVLNLQAGHSFYRKRRITYLNDLVNLRKTISDDPDLHDTTTFQQYSARGFVSNIPGKRMEYQTGFDLNHETALGKRTGGYRDITDLAGFINIIYRPIKHLSFQPGARVIYNSKFRAPLVYGINLKYSPVRFVMQASYARGFRAPSLKQMYLQFIDNNHEILGNDNLKAETADNISVSFSWDQSWKKQGISIGMNLFHNTIRNAIQLAINTQRPGWGTYFNVAGTHYKTKGLELKIGYRFSPSLVVTAGMITTGRLRLQTENRFDYSTDVVSSITYQHEKYRYQLALFYKYTDEYLEFAGNYNNEGQLNGVAQQYMAGYHTLDLTGTKSFMKNRISLSAGIRNLFNVTQVNAFGNLNIHGGSTDSANAGYGRTFFLKLGYRLDKL
jgi:outer membrane receptor for ferrienterochelin and colicins